jgi:hypothetical protein
MFYQIRRNNPTVEWVVLGLKKSILWEKDCAFCVENAAHARVTRVPIEHRKGVAAFNALFGEIGGAQPRAVLRIPDHYPTNPQAEVLVFDEIEPRYIMGALCPSNQMKEELAARYTDFQFIHSNGAFSYRSDFEHWR